MCSAVLSTTVCDMVPSGVFCEPLLIRPYSPTAFSARPIDCSPLAGFLFRFAWDFQVRVFRRLPLWRNAVGRQFGRRKHSFFCLQFIHYATSFLSTLAGTCTSSSNRER